MNLSLLDSLSCSCFRKSQIEYICCYSTCSQRLLCQKCKITHTQLHKYNIKSVSDISEIPIPQKIEEITSFVAQCLVEHSQTLDHLNYKLNDVKQTFDLLLENIKTRIIKEIGKLIPDSFYFEGLKTRISRLSEEINKLAKRKSTQEEALNSVQEYTGLILDLVEKAENFDLLKQFWQEQRIDIIGKLDNFSEQLDKSLIEVSLVGIPKLEDINEGKIKEIRVDNLKPCCKLEYEKSIFPNGLHYIEEKDLILCGLDDGKLIMLGEEVNEFQVGMSSITCIRYSESQKLIFTAHGAENCINVLKFLPDGSLRKVQCLRGHTDEVWSLLILEKQGWLLSGGDDDNLFIWSIKSLKKIGRIDTNERESIRADMIYIPNENLLCVGFYEGILALYNLKTKEPVCEIETHQDREHLLSLYFVESSSTLVVGCGEHHIQLYKIDKQWLKLRREIKLNYDTPRCTIPVNRELNLLVANFSNGLNMINLKEFDRIEEISGLAIQEAASMILIPQRKQIVIGTWLGEILILNYGRPNSGSNQNTYIPQKNHQLISQFLSIISLLMKICELNFYKIRLRTTCESSYFTILTIFKISFFNLLFEQLDLSVCHLVG